MQRAAEGHRRDADYEYGVGLLRVNQLDLVTVVASAETLPRSATVPSPQEHAHLAIWTSSMRSPTGRELVAKRSNCAGTLTAFRTLSVNNDSAVSPFTRVISHRIVLEQRFNQRFRTANL